MDALRARLRHLCAEYGVEEDRPDVMRAELVKRLDEDGWVEQWSRAQHESHHNPFERLQESTHRLLEHIQARGMIAGIGVIAAVAVVAIVVFWSNDDSPGPEPNANRYVIDPDEMTNAHGVVKYCTGTDIAGQQRADVDAFNRLYKPKGLEMELVELHRNADQELEKFTRYQRTGENACDVLYSDVIWTAYLVRNGWLFDLSRYFKERRQGDFVPTMLEAATIGEKTWGIPKQADAGLLFYRRDRVGQAPTTWQALYEQARTGRLRYQGLDYEGLTVNFLEIALAAGAEDIVTPEGKANINQKPAREALQFMVDGVRHAAPYQVVVQSEDENTAAFAKGRADFMRNWLPYAKKVLDLNPRLAGKVAITRLPSWSGGGRGSILGGHILVIPRLSENRGAALKAVDFLSSRKIVKRDATRFLLPPALSELWKDPDVQRVMPSVLKDAVFNATLRPRVSNYQDVSRAIYTNVNNALRGDVEPEEALDLANDQMNQALEASSPP